jgi:hypothetical protein
MAAKDCKDISIFLRIILISEFSPAHPPRFVLQSDLEK